MDTNNVMSLGTKYSYGKFEFEIRSKSECIIGGVEFPLHWSLPYSPVLKKSLYDFKAI